MTRRTRRFLRVRRETARWFIADKVNRLHWTCWADLVSWVQNWDDLRDSDDPTRRPWPPLRRCTDNPNAVSGTCYCDKQPPGQLARYYAAQPKPTDPDPWADR